jgi:hypothetical protein
LGAGCRGITVGERQPVRSAKRLQQTASGIGETQRPAVGVGNRGKLIAGVIGQGLRIAMRAWIIFSTAAVIARELV